MLEIKIKLRTDSAEEIPALMEEIAEKVAFGIDRSNAEKYSFKVEDNSSLKRTRIPTA